MTAPTGTLIDGEFDREYGGDSINDLYRGFTDDTVFRKYNSARTKQFSLIVVPLEQDFSFDVLQFIAAMTECKPAVMFLVSPNNPTGLPIPDQEIIAVLDALPQGTWAVLDRTRVNVCPEIFTAQLLRQYVHKDLVVLHSFSNLMSEATTQRLTGEGLFVMGGHEFEEPNPCGVRIHMRGDPEHTRRLCQALAMR